MAAANDVDVETEGAVVVEGDPCGHACPAVPWHRPDVDLEPRREATGTAP